MAESIYVNELLAQTDWLRRLARELVRDHHTADDLAQSSLSTALATPPRHSGASLRAWLRRVMVNRLRQDRRNLATRARLQPRVAGSAEAPSTLTLVARTEIQVTLIQELLALDEPYRTTILRRYYDHRSAAAIAREDDLPESTVRNRLHRGLGHLRERLRNRCGGDDTEWLPAVAGLALPEGAAAATSALWRLARTQKLALAGISLIGLAVLGVVLNPFAGSPVPPVIASTAGDEGDDPMGRADVGVPAEDTGVGRTAFERSAVAGSAGESFELRVLRPDGSPAPQALVRFATLADAQRQNRQRNGPHHPHSEVYRFAFLAEQYGQVREADGTGRVWLPVAADWLLVSALRDAAFATTTIPKDQRDPVTLRLAGDETLELRSVDRAGLPAGNLPLRVAVRVAGRADNTLWIGQTNDAGIAVVRHFQLLRPEARSAHYGVCFDFPVRPHVTVGFEDAPPDEPVFLTAPAHGLLELSFTDAEGGTLVSPVEYCRLQVDFPAGDPASDGFPAGEDRWIGGFPSAGEHVLRLPVGLGVRVSASGQFRPAGEIEEVSFAGPVQPGEVVAHALRLSASYAVVRGQLQNPEGATGLGAVLARGTEQGAVQAPALLPGGAFELAMRAGPSRPTGIYLHVRDGLGQERGSGLPLPASQVVDLGTVELSPLTAVFQGKVVDDRGAPVAGAEIQAWQLQGGQWVRDRRFQAVTGDDGGFRLSAPESEVGLGLLPKSRGYLVKGPSLPGDLPIAMMRAGAVTGSLVLPEWVQVSDLSVRVVPVAGVEAAVSVHPERNGDRAVFRARDLWPGRYRVELQIEGEPGPFADLGVLDVVAGEEYTDDRLGDIDLRDDLYRIELTAVDGLGAPLTLPGAGLTAFVPGPDGGEHRRNLRWREGHAGVLSSQPALEVELVARGYLPWRGTVQSGQQVIRLRER